MKKIVKLLSICLILSICLGLCACGKTASSDVKESKIEQIKEAGVLVVGTSADYPPYEFHTEIDGKDTIVGTEMSLMKYIADDLGVELKIVDMSFDGLVISLAQGDFDVVASCMRPSEERKKSIDFSDEWYENVQVVVVRKEDADMYESLDDLAGKKVAAQVGTSLYDYAVQYAGEDYAVGLTAIKDMILELKQGTVDAIIIEQMPAKSYCAHNEDLTYKDLGIERGAENASIGVQKGNEDLVEFLNEEIAKIKEEDLINDWSLEAFELAGTE